MNLRPDRTNRRRDEALTRNNRSLDMWESLPTTERSTQAIKNIKQHIACTERNIDTNASRNKKTRRRDRKIALQAA